MFIVSFQVSQGTGSIDAATYRSFTQKKHANISQKSEFHFSTDEDSFPAEIWNWIQMSGIESILLQASFAKSIEDICEKIHIESQIQVMIVAKVFALHQIVYFFCLFKLLSGNIDFPRYVIFPRTSIVTERRIKLLKTIQITERSIPFLEFFQNYHRSNVKFFAVGTEV